MMHLYELFENCNIIRKQNIYTDPFKVSYFGYRNPSLVIHQANEIMVILKVFIAAKRKHWGQQFAEWVILSRCSLLYYRSPQNMFHTHKKSLLLLWHNSKLYSLIEKTIINSLITFTYQSKRSIISHSSILAVKSIHSSSHRRLHWYQMV